MNFFDQDWNFKCGKWHFGTPCPHGPPLFEPPFLLGPKLLKSANQLLILWAISENTDGITGYNLQKKFGISDPSKPNSTIYRTLRKLENEGYLNVEEKIESGRVQKIYKITEKGIKFMDSLRTEIQNKIFYFVPPESFEFPFIFKFRGNFIKNIINNIKTIHEIKILIQNIEDILLNTKERLQYKLNYTEQILSELTNFKSKLEKISNSEFNSKLLDEFLEILKF